MPKTHPDQNYFGWASQINAEKSLSAFVTKKVALFQDDKVAQALRVWMKQYGKRFDGFKEAVNVYGCYDTSSEAYVLNLWTGSESCPRSPAMASTSTQIDYILFRDNVYAVGSSTLCRFCKHELRCELQPDAIVGRFEKKVVPL